MADYKVTDLVEILATSVAADDLTLLVDTSASDDKKIKVEELAKAAATHFTTGSINGDKLVDDSVTATQIADATITATQLATDSVARAEVTAGEISGAGTSRGKVHIEAGSINATDIASGSITNTQLSGGTLVPTGGITDSEVSTTAAIAVSKLESVSPNFLLAGPSTGATPAVPTARALVSADLPAATTSALGAVSVPTGNGLSLAAGVLSHTDTVTAADLGWISFSGTGHILSARALAAGDLPVASTSALGLVSVGTGLAVTSGGVLSIGTASSSAIGGLAIGSEFGLGVGSTLELATTGVSAGNYAKVTVNTKGVVTAGDVLADSDIPNHSAALLTSGTLDIARIGANTITGAKMANDSTCIISATTPASGDYEGQLHLNSTSNTLSAWNGSAFVGVSAQATVDDGTY
jgi:hypothetical protein